MLLNSLIFIQRKKRDKVHKQSISDSHVQIGIAILIVSIICFSVPPLRGLLSSSSTNLSKLGGMALVTSTFVHGSIPHLFSNLLFYFLYAPPIEEKIGKKNFVTLFLICAVLGGVVNYFMSKHLTAHNSIGASGVIYGLMAYASIIFKDRKVILLTFIKLPFWTLGAFFIVIEYFSAQAMYTGSASSNIGHIAHMAGALVGLMYYLIVGVPKPVKEKEKSKEEKWNENDYFDMAVAIFWPVLTSLYIKSSAFSRLAIICSCFYSYKLSMVLAIFFTYDTISSEKAHAKEAAEKKKIN